MFRLLPALGLLAVLVLGCQRSPEPGPPQATEQGPLWLEDVTDRLGIDFVHDAGPLDGAYPLPQITGSGVALLDCDGDGRLDLYLVNNGGPRGRPNQLYGQQPDGRFRNVSKGSGLDFAAYCMGVAVGDFNNDGRPDVLVTMVGGARLFLNQGKGVFRDVTRQSGLDNPAWGASAAFLDFDRDGLLDIVITNYVDFDASRKCTSADGERDYCSPSGFPSTASRLFRNAGLKEGGVRFEDRTLASGLGKVPGPGLGVCCADFDGDGWVDIFVANDGKPNHLWINQHDGAFKEEAVQRGLAYDGMGQAQAGMGVALGDVDGDGLLDVFVTHVTEEQHTLWKQGPRGLYRDGTTQTHLSRPGRRSTGFGTALLDLDNDGWPDLVLASGRVARGAAGPSPSSKGTFWTPYEECNQVFANEAGRFRDISRFNPALCGQPNVARGLAVGDINQDGGLDVVLTTAGGPAKVFFNMAPRGHGLRVRCLERTGTREALGAEVMVRAGGRRQVRVLQTADSFLSASEPVVHFGLGKEDTFEEIEVRWPDGSGERFPGGKAKGLLVLRQGSGQSLAPAGKGKP